MRGSASIFVLLFGVVTSVFIGGVVLLASSQYDYMRRNNASEQALSIAEAGVQYYRWHLAHSPSDYTDATGHAGPYVHEYKDPQGGVIGYYSLLVTAPPSGSTTVTISSTGYTKSDPTIKRTVSAQFGIPSLARYSFLHNANSWFGSGLTVHGRVLSNGGIRQDGINDSVIQSAKTTYTCGSETGCSPTLTRPGVWGAGGPSTLWEYPVTAEDFDAISVDFSAMKTDAQASGVYYAASPYAGYHVVFNSNGTVSVYEVRSTSYYRGYDTDTGCTNLYQRISTETLKSTYSLSTKHIFFFEDTVWVNGTVSGKATVVAAKFPIDTNNEDMWISGSVTYAAKNGASQLGLIAQRNIYFVKDLPAIFEIDAALLAQKGKIIRHDYNYGSCATYSNAVRTQLIIYGSIISNQKSYWNWGTTPSSGFTTRDITYDNHLYLIPPPYFPSSGDYEFIYWSEDSHN
jgi:hypothetical protein